MTRFLHNALIIGSGIGFFVASFAGWHFAAMILLVVGAVAYIHKEEQ